MDCTGRIVREDKNGPINNQLPPILDRLEMDVDAWMEIATQFEALYYRKFGIRRRQNAEGFGELSKLLYSFPAKNLVRTPTLGVD